MHKIQKNYGKKSYLITSIASCTYQRKSKNLSLSQCGHAAKKKNSFPSMSDTVIKYKTIDLTSII